MLVFRVMAGEWTTEYFRFGAVKGPARVWLREIDEETGNHFQEVYEHELENITMLDEMRMTLDFLKEKMFLWGLLPMDQQSTNLKG